MQVLTGASNVKIDRSNFSNVGRDQYNYNNCTIIQPTRRPRDKKREVSKNLPDLSEFTEIKRGNIYKDKDVCYSWRLCSNGKDDTEGAVYYAQLNIAGSLGEKRFTVKTYRGRNAMREWRRDFLQCSRDWLGDTPLFGYSQSTVPLLIFYGELIPVAHIESGLGIVGLYYIYSLSYTLECSTNQIWMDPTRGRFCCGPIGPKCLDWWDVITITVPSDVSFLKEDVLIQYLSCKKKDAEFLAVVAYTSHFERQKDNPDHTEIISGLTNLTIAFIQKQRWWSWKTCLDDGELMPDEATIFHLRDNQRKIEVQSDAERLSWLSQALGIFHACDISFHEDLSNYKLVHPSVTLRGTLHKSKHKQQRRQLSPPIYFIVLSSTYPLYYWTFDPTGQTPLSLDMCKYLGLPSRLSLEIESWQSVWPTKTYKLIYDYQIARGFSPKTMDFAQSLQLPIFNIVPPKNHFQEIVGEHYEIPAELENLPLQEVSEVQELTLESEESHRIR